MYVTASDSVNITVDFRAPSGELTVPDAGTFNYKVLRLDGTVVSTETPTIGVSDTTAVITLTSPVTDKVGIEDIEMLRLKASYQITGSTYTKTTLLYLVEELKYIVEPSDIRSLLGATDLVLDDSLIDLFGSYIDLKNSPLLGDKVLDDELLAGGYRARVANNLIKFHAACEVIDKLRLSLIKTHTEDNISVTHFETDLNSLKHSMNAKFEEALISLNPAASSLISASGEGLFVVTTPVDNVTGV